MTPKQLATQALKAWAKHWMKSVFPGAKPRAIRQFERAYGDVVPFIIQAIEKDRDSRKARHK